MSILAVVIVLITSQSCKNGFLEGVNDNPNSPSEVTPRVLLPGAEGNLAYALGGDLGRYTALMTQYVTGASRQFSSYNSYVFTEEDFNNLWNNLYAATMKNYFTIIQIEEALRATTASMMVLPVFSWLTRSDFLLMCGVTFPMMKHFSATSNFMRRTIHRKKCITAFNHCLMWL